MPEKSNKLSIYLIKEGLDATAIVKSSSGGHTIHGVGQFYAEPSHADQPSWFADFFGGTTASPVNILVASAKAVLLVSTHVGDSERTFALTFGHGRHMLNEDVYEEQFGLKIVLNSVEPKSLRSLDKTTLGSVPKQTREQMSRISEASSFGLDIEQDLVTSVTGKSRYPELGRTISGRDALAVTVKVDSSNIREFLTLCMKRYQSDEYKHEFDWIDQIKAVRDGGKCNNLYKLIIEKMIDRDLNKIWMAPPDILDWVDVKGFKYGKSRKKVFYDDLTIDEFLDVFNDQDISLEFLSSTLIHAVSAKTDKIYDQWTALRCIYGEIEHEGSIYILNDRRWYEIAPDFVTSVRSDFENTPEADVQVIEYNHEGEGAYNISLCETILGSCCMDGQLVMHGGSRSRIEFCDVLTDDKKLLHVKRYSGSAQLSHLFSQGAIAGELFAQDPDFRAKLNEKLPESHKLLDPEAQPNPHDYEIIFGIITDRDELDLPFFSKLTLRNARRRLRGYGYSVAKKRIGQAITS